jgi:hypothetical protein
MSDFSTVLINMFEQALSSDVNRIQSLANREFQNILKNAWECSATRNDILTAEAPANPALNSVSDVPNITTNGSSMVFAMTAGQALMLQTPISSAEAALGVINWADIQFTIPPAAGSDNRTDTVYIIPASVATDPQLRNILANPVSRTVVQTTVNKTINPTAVPQYSTGVATPDPIPPAAVIPSGALPLIDIYVPAFVTSSDQCFFTRRTWRKTVPPFSGITAIVENMDISWPTQNDEFSGPSSPPFVPPGRHSVLIGGEVITWDQENPFTITEEDSDNPLVDNSAVLFDTPYYIYACGGSGAPYITNSGCPLVFMYSMTVPFGSHASANLMGPRGVIPMSSTLYVGIGYLVASRAFIHKPLIMRQSDNWIFPVLGYFRDSTQHFISGQSLGTVTTIPLNCAPAASVGPTSRMSLIVSTFGLPGTVVDLPIEIGMIEGTPTSNLDFPGNFRFIASGSLFWREPAFLPMSGTYRIRIGPTVSPDPIPANTTIVTKLLGFQMHRPTLGLSNIF